MVNPIRVLHCIPHVHLGGADLCAIELVHELDSVDGIDARICVFQGNRAPPERLTRLREPLLLDFRGKHTRPNEFLRFRKSIRQSVEDWKPNIVHSHLWPACRWATSALLNTNVRHVWHIHDTRQWIESTRTRDRLFRVWTRWLIGRAKPRLLSVSRAAAQHSAKTLGFRAEDCQIVPCGIDPYRFQSTTRRKSARNVVGLAAQFRPEKGHDVLLRAVQLLAQQGVDVELRLAGDGSTWTRMQELAAELGLEKQVLFLGHVHDIPGFLSELDLFVLPSRAFEGLPVCLLEAMSMRIPVVATEVAGTPEIVRDGVTGRLVPPGDVEALAQAMAQSLASQATEFDDMLDRAKRLIRGAYTVEAVSRKVHDVYRHVLENR